MRNFTMGFRCSVPASLLSTPVLRTRLLLPLLLPRLLLLLMLPLLLIAACSSAQTVRSSLRYRLLGETTIAHGTLFNDTRLGGLSGIDRSPNGTLYLISDDRSATGPARFYTADIDIASSGVIAFRPTSVTTLRDLDGKPFARGTIDPESIRYDVESNTLWVTSEGDESLLIDPFVAEMRLDGSFIRRLPLPSMFRMDTVNETGPRNNGVFEAMTLSADGSEIIVSTEEVLKQDGPALSPRNGGVLRFTFYDRESGRMLRQIGYRADRAPAAAHDTLSTGNGVVEILARDRDHLLVLERAFTEGIGVSVRLYDVDISNATNIASLPSTSGMLAGHATKTLAVDFATLGLTRIDNIEGIAWGPIVVGRQTLVVVSDDNFNERQVTQVIVLIEGEP